MADPIVILDIDGTIITGGNLVQRVYDYARSLEGAIFIVTGRPESDRANTVSQLRDLGIRYSRLIMNPGSTSDSVAYKKATAENLLQTYKIVMAIENNPDALRAYRSLGIEAKNPSSIPEQNGAKMSKVTRALPGQLAVGDYVAWIIQTDCLEEYAGVITDLTETDAKVSVWDEEDDLWSDSKLIALVDIGDLKKIEPLPTEPLDAPAMPAAPDTIDMPGMEMAGQLPTRSKWLRVANDIKARLEGFETEGRSLGKAEIRTNHIEMRAASGDGMTFEGYASVFNQPSEPLPFIEYVKPGAFKRSLQSRNRMMLLWNHDSSNPLASTRNGSLALTEDATGLKVRATLPDTTLGRDIAELVRTGVIDAMSFGFSVKKDSWSNDGSARYLEDVTLYEVSLVSTPAYEQTSGTVSVRSADPISADALAEAFARIEEGTELEPEQGKLISDVIARLTKSADEPAEDLTLLKQKKLHLLEMVANGI